MSMGIILTYIYIIYLKEDFMNYNYLKNTDAQIYDCMKKELDRQQRTIELIASENIVSEAVMETMGSFLTNKYSEGYPSARYYGGCEEVDKVEQIAIERAKELFGAEFANVQPHSGSQANFGVYFAFLKPGDLVLGMDLSHGGHLTHGSPVNVSGMYYKFISYGVDQETLVIDYDEFEKIALEKRPKMIVAGASAYPRAIDFEKMSAIAKKIDALFMVDMAHIAGLVAANLHMNPCKYADVVTTTTHKTLRGPRGGLILGKQEYEKAVNKAIFPGIQGGPLQHIIASKAVCFKEAMSDDFKKYQEQVVKNAKALAKHFMDKGYNVITGGTDNHLILINLANKNITGKEAQDKLDLANITLNKNSVPFDTQNFIKTGGVRIGSPAVTTRGMVEEDMKLIVDAIDLVISEDKNEEAKAIVKSLTDKYPLYKDIVM